MAAAAAAARAEQDAFRDLLQDICDLSLNEANAIVSQGYNTARKFRRIDKDSMKELFNSNVVLECMKVVRRQNLRALRAWLHDRDPRNIDLSEFTEDVLENQCDSLATEREVGGKGDSDKSQDKPFVWDGDIFKLGAWLERMYAWLGLKKNGRGVPLTWLAILRDSTPDGAGNPLEGAGFDEDPWTRKYRTSAPQNVKSWASNMDMSGPQYLADTQELYNHIVGRIKGEPLTVARSYLNDGHRALRALLRKYMNGEQRRLMARAARGRLPGLKYQNEKGQNGLRDHVAALAEIFRTLEAAGAPISEAEKVMHLTESITNEKLATGTVSHIVASKDLANDFTAACTHIITTAAHLKITGPRSGNREGGRRREIGGVDSGSGGDKSRKDLEKMAKGYIDGRKWNSLSRADRDIILKYRKDHNLGKGKGPRQPPNRNEEESDAETRSSKRRKKENAKMKRMVSTAVAEAVEQLQDPEQRVRFETQEDEGEEGLPASARFGRRARRQSAITSTNRRRIGDTRSIQSARYKESSDLSAVGRVESDSHADTVCAGAQFRKLSGTGVVCEVGGFGEGLGSFQDVEISTTCTAWDSPEGETYILVYGQSLFFGDALEVSLVPPNQLRSNGLVVDDVPKQFTKGRSLHGIYVPEKNLTIPFSLRGMMSYIPVRLPSEEEMERCQRIQMTSEEDWRPYSSSWAENEEGFSEIDPSDTFKSEPVEETTSLSVREVDQVTGRFQGFKRVVISAVAMTSLWTGRTAGSLWASQNPECYGVGPAQTGAHYREIFGVRVSGDYSPAMVP